MIAYMTHDHERFKNRFVNFFGVFHVRNFLVGNLKFSAEEPDRLLLVSYFRLAAFSSASAAS